MNLGFDSKTVEKLDSIAVPTRYYQRLRTGNDRLDRLFGGDTMPGIAPFMSILLTGTPGAGKSTFAMQLADALAWAGSKVFYNAGEQSKYVVKMTSDRLNLKGAFEISQKQEIGDLLSYCRDNEVRVLIQDSVQTLRMGKLKGKALITELGEEFQRFADKENVLTIVLGQVTKSGSMAGPMALKHTLDAHLHMSVPKVGPRMIEFEKNRFGPTSKEFYTLSHSGFTLAEPTAESEEAKLTFKQVYDILDQMEADEATKKSFWQRILRR